MANMTNDNNTWILNQAINAPGTITKTLDTAGTFVDKDIAISTTTPTGAYNISVNSSGTITPTVSIDSGSTYGFTSGTLTGNYLTIDPGATVKTKWKATSTIVTPGYLVGQYKDVEVSPTIEAGTNYYVPIVTPTLSGGDLTVQTHTNNLTTTPVVTVEEEGSFRTASGYGFTTTKPSGTDGTNYLTINGKGVITTSGKATSTFNVSSAPITYSNSAGVIAAHSNTSSNYTGKATGNKTKDLDIIPVVTDNFEPYYIPITSVTFTGGGVTGSTTTAISTNMTSGTNSSPYYIDAVATGTAKANAVYYTNNPGAIAEHSASTAMNQSANLNVGSSAPRYFVKEATFSNTGGSLSNTSNFVYKPDISIISGAANTSTLESGSFTLGSQNTTTYPYYIQINSTSSSTSGNTKVERTAITQTRGAGYSSGGTFTLLASGSSSPTVTVNQGSGQVYLNIKNASITPAYTANNISTYFDAGTSSDNGINITPSYTNTAGYTTTHSSAQNGTTTYYKIKTTSVVQGASSISNGTLIRGSASWGTGWINAGNLNSATLANSATSGVTYLDISSTSAAPILISNDYLYINKGYIDNLKISLARLVPDSASNNLAASHILAGYSAYNSSGQLITGNIQTKSMTDIISNGQTYSIPAGYYPNSGTITVPAGTVKSGSGKITALSYDYDATNNRFNISGTTTISAPTSSIAGYISNSVGTKQTNTATVETSVPKIAIKSTLSANTGILGTRTPVISRTATTATGATNVGSAAATTSAPTSGYFVSVQSAADKYTITATPSVTTAGYGTTTQYDATSVGPTTIGAEQSAVTYIPIASATVSNSASASAQINSTSISYNSSAGNFSITGNSNITGTATLTVSNAGWLPKNNISANFTSNGGATLASTLTKIGIKAEMTGTAKVTPTITRTATTASGATNVGSAEATTNVPTGGYFVSVKSSAAANTITATPSVISAGYGTTSQYNASGSTLSVGANESSITYIPITAAQATTNSANVEVLSTDGSNAGVNIAGIVQTASATTTEPSSGYYLFLKGSGSSKISTAGWIPTGALNTTSSSKYFPVTAAGITFTEYSLSLTNGTTISPSVSVAEASTTDTNMSNYAIGDKDTTNYPYYFKIRAASTGGSHTLQASTTETKDTRTAGYLPARGATTIIAGKSASSTVTVSTGSKETYIKLKRSTITSSGANITTYFTSGTSADNSIAIYHTATAGYTPALASGSTATYWKIRQGSATISNGVLNLSQGWIEDGSSNVSAGAYSAAASLVTAGTITPSVAISSSGTYGVTTTQPSGSYITIDPNATVTTKWKAKGTASITTAGWIPAGSKENTYEGTPSIAAGTNAYIPVVVPSFSGGGLTTGTDITSNTISVTGMKTTTTNTGYAINATAAGTAGTNTVSMTLSPGVVKSYSASGVVAAASKALSKTAATVYIQSGNVSAISGGSIEMSGGQTITPQLAISSGATTSGPTLLEAASYSLGAVNSGTYAYYYPIKATTTGNASTTITATRAAASVTKTEGYITSGTISLTSGTGTRTVSASNTTGTTTYLNIKKLTGSVTGNNTVTPSVSVGYNANVTLSTTDNGIQITATGGGTASATATATATAAGYLVSGATIATATLSASSNTTSTSRYITAVTVPKDKTFSLTTTADTALDTTSNVTITNNAYRNLVVNNAANGTVVLGNSGTVNATNKGTTTVTSFASGSGNLNVVAYSGTSALGSQQIVTNGQWKVQTQTAGSAKTGPFYGVTYINPMSSCTSAAVTVGANATASSPTVAKHSDTNVQSSAITTSKPGSGYYVAVQGTAPATTLTFTKAVGTAGYIGATSQITASGSVAAKTGSTYYVPITAGAATVGANATATSPTIAKHSDTNASAGTITTSKPSSGYYVAVQGTAPATTLTFTKAINTSGYVSAVSQITASGSVAAKTGSTYYVPLTNAAGSVTMTAGNGACGISSASGVTYASTNAYSNGVGVTFTGSGQVSATAKITTAGYTPTNNSFATGSATSSSSVTSTQYIKGITLNKPSSGWSHFDLTIPNGASDMMTLCFHIDSSGNVVIDDQPGVVPS